MNKTNKINYTDTGIEALAMAITELAAFDYQNEFDRSNSIGEPTPKLMHLDDWFDSELGQLCSFGQADLIRDKIRKGEKVVITSAITSFEPVLTVEDIEFIKTHYKPYNRQYNLQALAKMFAVGTTTIWRVIKGEYSYGE